MKEDDSNRDLALGGTGLGIGSILTHRALRKGDLTGRKTMYHNTDKSNVPNIFSEGLKASKASDPNNLTHKGLNAHIALGTLKEKDLANKVYMANSRMPAFSVGIKAEQLKNGKNSFAGDPEDIVNALRNRKTVKVQVPLDDLGTKVKTVPNPELRGAKNHKEYHEGIKDLVDRADKYNKDNGFYAPKGEVPSEAASKEIFNALGKGTTTVEGDIPSNYIKGGKGFKNISAEEILSHAKKRPGSFGKGLGGIALAGLGAGYLGKGIYDKAINKQALTAENARVMAKKVGLIPEGQWKWALRNMRGAKGKLLEGKELGQAKKKLGSLSNNDYQNVISTEKHHGRLGGEVSSNIDMKTNKLLKDYDYGVGGQVRRKHPSNRTIHTHPEVPADAKNSSILLKAINQKGIYSDMSGINYSVLKKLKNEKVLTYNFLDHTGDYRSALLHAVRNPKWIKQWLKDVEFGKQKELSEAQAQEFFKTKPLNHNLHNIITPSRALEGVHKVHPTGVRSIYFDRAPRINKQASLEALRKKRYWGILKRLHGGNEEAMKAIKSSGDSGVYHGSKVPAQQLIDTKVLPGTRNWYGKGVYFGAKSNASKYMEGEEGSLIRLKKPNELKGTKINYPSLNEVRSNDLKLNHRLAGKDLRKIQTYGTGIKDYTEKRNIPERDPLGFDDKHYRRRVLLNKKEYTKERKYFEDNPSEKNDYKFDYEYGHAPGVSVSSAYPETKTPLFNKKLRIDNELGGIKKQQPPQFSVEDRVIFKKGVPGNLIKQASLEALRKKQYWGILKRLHGGNDEAIKAVKDSKDSGVYHGSKVQARDLINSKVLPASENALFGKGAYFGSKGSAGKYQGEEDSLVRLKKPSELAGTKLTYPNINQVRNTDLKVNPRLASKDLRKFQTYGPGKDDVKALEGSKEVSLWINRHP